MTTGPFSVSTLRCAKSSSFRGDRRGGPKREIPNLRVGRGFHLPVGDMLGLMPLAGEPMRRWSNERSADASSHDRA